MKLKTHVFIISLIIICFLPKSVFCGELDTTKNYSIKHRYSIKAGFSQYKCWHKKITYISLGNFEYSINVRRPNFKVEINYGISNYFEIGAFAGFQRYAYTEPFLIPDTSFKDSSWLVIKKTLAPVLGLNVNFHILPIFVTTESCRWDLYLTAKYGMCFLPYIEFAVLKDVDKMYRQEYGVGFGLSYYIKNKIGFYSEIMAGDFSYFPRFVDSNFNSRIGITCKF